MNLKSQKARQHIRKARRILESVSKGRKAYAWEGRIHKIKDWQREALRALRDE